MAVSLLDRAIYSYPDVDRLVGLHSGTARRWLEGYERGERFHRPVLRERFRTHAHPETRSLLADPRVELVVVTTSSHRRLSLRSVG